MLQYIFIIYFILFIYRYNQPVDTIIIHVLSLIVEVSPFLQISYEMGPVAVQGSSLIPK